jgi:hypothetical protein
MDASLVSKQDLDPTLQTIHNTYRQHVATVNELKVPQMPSFGPTTTYFGKLLEIVLKWAKVDGCKPSF